MRFGPTFRPNLGEAHGSSAPSRSPRRERRLARSLRHASRGRADASGFGRDQILDFQNDIDTLRLDEDLWGGGKSVAQVLADHAIQAAPGVVLFDFGGGDLIRVEGFRLTVAQMQNDIVIT